MCSHRGRSCRSKHIPNGYCFRSWNSCCGGFYDEKVSEIIGAAENEYPLYIMPISRPTKLYRISFEEISNFYKGDR